MVQPKYSPEEALHRIKLMMEYDSSKTLSENEKLLKEDAGPWERAGAGTAVAGTTALGGWAGSAAAGALVGTAAGPVGTVVGAGIGLILGILGMNAWMSGDATEEKKIKEFLKACDSSDARAQKYITKSSMNPTDQAALAKIFGKAVNWQALSMFGGTDDSEDTGWRAMTNKLEAEGSFGDVCAVRQMYGGSKFEDRIISELDDEEQAEFAGALGIVLARTLKGDLKVQSTEALGANWWLDNFQCLMITNSFVDGWEPLLDPKYQTNYVQVQFKTRGVVKVYHMDNKGRIYVPTGSGLGRSTGKAVVCQGDKVTIANTVSESVQKKKLREQADLGDIDFSPLDVDLEGGGGGTPAPAPAPGPTPVRTGYRSCSGSYSYGCKTDPTGPIGVVQGCLGGLVVDGKFGPRTQSALKAKGYESFTDAEVDKICGIDSIEDTDVQDIEGLRANQL
jgi:hypothetical protein